MKNAVHTMASIVLKGAAVLSAAPAFAAAAQVPANWQQHVLPATDSTKLIAIAGTPGRDAFEIDGAGKQETLFRGQAKAPDYLRFHSVDVVRDTAAAYLAGLRSRADGPRRRYELVFARIPDR